MICGLNRINEFILDNCTTLKWTALQRSTIFLKKNLDDFILINFILLKNKIKLIKMKLFINIFFLKIMTIILIKEWYFLYEKIQYFDNCLYDFGNIDK